MGKRENNVNVHTRSFVPMPCEADRSRNLKYMFLHDTGITLKITIPGVCHFLENLLFSYKNK